MKDGVEGDGTHGFSLAESLGEARLDRGCERSRNQDGCATLGGVELRLIGGWLVHEKERIWLAYWSIEGREVIRLRRPRLTIESSLVPSCGGPISPTSEDSTLE